MTARETESFVELDSGRPNKIVTRKEKQVKGNQCNKDCKILIVQSLVQCLKKMRLAHV